MTLATKFRGIGKTAIKFLPLSALLLSCAFLASEAHAATLAGTNIQNQAALSYTDGSGLAQTATSNPVSTLVQQVGGVSLTNDNNKTALPLTSVVFPHTITNNGNGNDIFNLSVADLTGDNFNITPLIYADANGDGQPDGLIPLPISATPQLAPGQSFQFVVVGTVPLGATGSGKVKVTGTSRFDSSATDFNTDTVNVTTKASIDVTKSIDVNSGTPGSGPYTYTLLYNNTGGNAATDLLLTDALPLGVTYVPGSAKWSSSGSTALGDGLGGDPTGINYNYSGLTRTLSADVATVPANSTGKLTFQVTINSGLSPQVIKNFALFSYNDGSLLRDGNLTNTVNLTALQLGAVTFLGDTAIAAPQGATVAFANTLTNIGTGSDTFNVAINSGDNFPAGTTFSLYKSDGVTPLVDTNNDNIPDTGPVNPLGSYVVILKAKLPANASGVGPFIVTKTATSIFDPTKRQTATDTLPAITAGSVDLTNGVGLGEGLGPELTPVTNLLGLPSTTQRFSLWVKNGSAVADNFDLTASSSTSFSPVGPFPDGVKVVFKNQAGTVITNTGSIAAGANVKFYADVTLPAGLAPQDLRFYFRAASLVTGVLDTKLDGITINPIRQIALAPNNAGQAFRGGSVVYTHVLTNNGTTPEGGLASTVDLATANSVGAFTSVIYLDANNNGTLDDTDPAVTGLTSALLPTQSVTLFVKVYTPVGASLGAADTTTITATTSGGLLTPPAVVTANDVTTVLAGQLKVEKFQALDDNGDGSPEGAYAQSSINSGATPGKVIRYRIVVTNTGTSDATNVVVSDAIPAHTVYDTGDGNNAADGTPDAAVSFDGTTYTPAATAPANGGTGSLSFNIGTLAPGKSVVVTFGVKIQ